MDGCTYSAGTRQISMDIIVRMNRQASLSHAIPTGTLAGPSRDCMDEHS